MLPVLRRTGTASRGIYLDFPRPREWKTGAGRYRALFAAYAIQPQDILLRLPNERLYIAPHVQEHLVGLDAEWEDRLPSWTLEVQGALETSDGPPPFSTATAATPERTGRTQESGPLHTGPAEQGGAARTAAERRNSAVNRGASPCAYCGRALEESTGDSAVDSLWALISHGEQLHARCMLDRTERFASGHADP